MENKDIEIIEEEKEGISIGDIFKKIWHAKITLGVTFVVSTVVCVLGIHYLYSKPQEVYSGSVTYQFRGAEDGEYPNNTTFDYRTLIEPEVLQSVKDSNESFANIDIGKMISNNDISVSQLSRTSYNEQNQEVTVIMPNYISITCSASYFSDDNQAREFLRGVLDYANLTANSLYNAIIYNQNLIMADSAPTYEEEYNYLINQKDMLVNNYNTLIDEFGESSYVGQNSQTTISQALTEIERYFIINDLNSLQNDARQSGYIKDSSPAGIQKLESQLNNLIHQRDLTRKTLDNLQTEFKNLIATSNSSVILQVSPEYQNRIMELTVELTNYNDQIEMLCEKLNVTIDSETGEIIHNSGETKYNEAPESYKENLASIKTQLNTFTNNLKDTTTYLYTNFAKPIYTLPTIVEKSGGLSLILNAAISVVIGIILGCIVAGIKGHVDMKKEEQNKEDALKIAENNDTTK